MKGRLKKYLIGIHGRKAISTRVYPSFRNASYGTHIQGEKGKKKTPYLNSFDLRGELQMSIAGKHFYRFKYLKSDHWQSLRLEKLANAGAKCCRCNHVDISNDVHHLNYRNLYDVTLMDLVVLCRSCHEKIHETMDAAREAIASGADPREEWKMFINIWGEKPNEIVEVRKFMVEMRKRIESLGKAPWVPKNLRMIKKAKPAVKPSLISLSVPIPLEDYIRYRDLATKCGIRLGTWVQAILATHIPPESDDLPRKHKKVKDYMASERVREISYDI